MTGVVHLLFKDYHTCARSFSPLPPLAPLSRSRPARARKLTKPLPLLRMPPPTLVRKLLTLLRVLLLTALLLSKRPLMPLKPALLPLATLLLTLLAKLPRLLKTLPRRCNLRLLAQELGASGKPGAPFRWAPRAQPCNI